MRIPAIKRLVLFLALLLCQLTAFAHVTQHATIEPNQPCQICLHAPGLDAGATAPAQAALPMVTEDEAPVHAAAVAPAIASDRYAPIRAPPVFIA